VFRNQKGTFYNGEMWWLMLGGILFIAIATPIIGISKYGVDGWWAEFTKPVPASSLWNTFTEMGINVALVMGLLIGGSIVLTALFFIGYWTLNYFVFNKNEPNSKCRIRGHFMTDKEGEPLHIVCSTCGKDFGQYKVISTFNRKTGEIKDYE